ncbi:cation:proton antiporter domain-containing protein [Paenibacillus sp. DMB20]|uniref:cation:proton antiporter domain-containing protein n=1 Tax=Paenibacillus sp. DMB20 TaxID=1642570 RepID=UPI000B0CB44F
MTLIANSLIFLMIGLEIKNIDFTDKWILILAAIATVLVARTVALYASVFWIKDFPGSWKAILNWGGLKGSLSIALALSLPSGFEGREDVLVLTFSVVLFSLLVQGLSIKRLVVKLGLGGEGRGRTQPEST